MVELECTRRTGTRPTTLRPEHRTTAKQTATNDVDLTWRLQPQSPTRLRVADHHESIVKQPLGVDMGDCSPCRTMSTCETIDSHTCQQTVNAERKATADVQSPDSQHYRG